MVHLVHCIPRYCRFVLPACDKLVRVFEDARFRLPQLQGTSLNHRFPSKLLVLPTSPQLLYGVFPARQGVQQGNRKSKTRQQRMYLDQQRKRGTSWISTLPHRCLGPFRRLQEKGPEDSYLSWLRHFALLVSW